ATLNLTNAQLTSVGTYFCRVSSTCSSIVSDGFTLSIRSAPSIDQIAAPLSPQLINSTVALSATIGGNGLAGATWKWQWGDGTTSEGPLTSASLTVTHKYTLQGVYTPTLILTDACNQSVAVAYQYVVIYNPDGGFVTGGGWINSPKGAYKENLELTGKATFGFVAKYTKGSTVPKGNTEFQFKAGNLHFNSTAYDDMRLVVAGARANLKGVGTLNGTGNYGFLVSAIDGQINGGGGVDKFRIKIWNKATDQIVYDNNLNNSGDDGDPEMALGGGSVVIHSESKNARQSSEDALTLTADAIVLRNYPNPASDKTTIEFMVPQGGDYTLDIQDLTGSVVRHLQTGQAVAGQLYQVSWEVGKVAGGMYITRLTTPQGVKVSKLLVK
ncbi:MAG TPA: T9SS type A sorting domain-containing protein, partial [Fibrella sp.]